MLMINTCKPTNWPKARDSKFTRQSELVFELKMLFQVYSDRLDPGKGWCVLNEELHVSTLRKHKENSFFRLFPAEVKMVPFCELNDGSGNPLDPTLLGVKYKKCDVLVASTLGL